ncbi:MAG: AfsR/SARP family transcriptional regulator [bacterium]|nr:AfsR/SARP family transcriptional regulator [bacterium]
MKVRVLGPVECTVDGALLSIDTAKERVVLCVLALRAGHVVGPGALIDALWGDDPPATAARTLGTHVSRLRGMVGADVIQGGPAGLCLDIGRDDVDALVFEDLVAQSQSELSDGRPELAGDLATRALNLWRGDPLADLADGDVRRGELVHLDEQRRQVAELRITAELALGHHGDLIGEIEAAVAADPLRESLWGHLMVALYRGGRQADALRAFERLRSILGDELGLEPSAGVTRIEHQILRQDPQLDLVPPPPPSNLPVSNSSFVGREDEVAGVVEALKDHRLVTIVGPAGVGKTRLALEAAGELVDVYSNGTWWVDLAAVREPTAVPTQIAAAVRGIDPGSVALDDAIVEFARTRSILLVIDNCEHLLPSTAQLIHRVLQAGESVRVLATSRERLGVPGEKQFRLGPMAVPPVSADDEELLGVESMRLFADRALVAGVVASGTDLGSAAEICRRVEGLPLAIELVAARTAFLDPNELLERVGDRLVEVAGQEVIDPRYDSLVEALAWSYELLASGEKELLCQLSVFPASFDVDAATAVAGQGHQLTIEHLGRLVGASMVETVRANDEMPDSGRRFRLLVAVREFAAARLGHTPALETQRRHSAHYRSLARELTLQTTETLQRLRVEDVNLRAAVAWSLQHDPPTVAIEFGPALGLAWYASGDLTGCIGLLDELLDGSDGGDAALRGWTAYRLALSLMLHDEGERAFRSLDLAENLARESGESGLLGAVLWLRGHTLLLSLGAIDAAIPLYKQALDTDGISDFDRNSALLCLSQANVFADEPEGVRQRLDLVASRLVDGADDDQLAHLCMVRAMLAWCIGDDEAIAEVAQLGVDHARKASNTAWEQINLVLLGIGLLATGRPDEAELPLLRAAGLATDTGNLLQLGVALQGLAALAAENGDALRSDRLWSAGLASAPLWPLVRRRLEPYRRIARDAMGEDLEIEIVAGEPLEPTAAYALAVRGSPGFGSGVFDSLSLLPEQPRPRVVKSTKTSGL